MNVIDAAVEPRTGSRWQAEVESLRMEARSRFRSFIERRSNPAARERDRRNSPVVRSLFEEAAEIGLLPFSLPTDVGGEGRSKFEWGILLEELATVATDPGFSILLDVSVETTELILRTGRPDLAERYVPRLVSGQSIGMAASYENRDYYDYTSTARQVGDGWVLNGRKAFVAAARMADLFVVYVRDEESNDLLGFLVERDDPGVTISGLETMGLRSLGLGQITLYDVRLPGERLVWHADALSEMNAYLSNRRLTTACALVGTMDALTARCVERLSTRIRGGRPVLDYPNVERSVGEMRVAIETSRAIVHRALDATRGHRDRYFDVLATAAKQQTAETAVRVGQLVMNLQGGQSYMTLQPWERYMRDVLGLIGGQGAQELLLIQLGQRTVTEIDAKQARDEAADRTAARLGASFWALSTLGAALDSGLLDELSSLRTSDEITARRLEVLTAAGLLRRREDGLARLEDDLHALLSDATARAALEAEVRSTLSAGAAFFASARDGVLDGEPLNALGEAGVGAGDALRRLIRSSCAFAVLAAALETRLLDELALLRSPDAVGDRIGAPGGVVERMLAILAEAGLVRHDGGGYAIHAGLEPALFSGARRTALESDARSTLTGLAGSLAGEAEPDRLHEGTAGAFCEALLERHIAELEGLDDLLREPSARVLVVGPGSAELAIELCRWLLSVRVVGLEEGPAALTRANADVAAAGFADRVEVHDRGVGDATEPGTIALACVPAAFHGRGALAEALAGMRSAVSDGGWVVAVMPSRPRDALGAAVWGLRTALCGGDPLLDEEALEGLLRASGFPLPRTLEQLPGLRLRLLAARNLQASS
ncbi:MAG: acyl-CoA dehydrogenase family protein [Actinomycetota bacterium]|nr:acyl-CoA dehydrogenase family protein [Actinomycetota bacterium]